ncbi:hypothetical protein ABPG72_000191 [Tetrahymena utriculariae]
MQLSNQISLLKLVSGNNSQNFDLYTQNQYLFEVHQEKDLLEETYENTQNLNQSIHVDNLEEDILNANSTIQNNRNCEYENFELNPILMKNIIRQFFKFIIDQKNTNIVLEFFQK